MNGFESGIENGDKCNLLLKQFEQADSNHQEAMKKYAKNSQLWQEQLSDDVKRQMNLERTKDIFKQSQYVEMNSRVFNCIHTNTLKRNDFLKSAQEKCKCQQMYGGRGHLFSLSTKGDTILSREECESKGYLENNNIEERTCPDHLGKNLLDYKCDCPAEVNETKLRIDHPPTVPQLVFPSITCKACKLEFEELMMDFSYANVEKVENCISNMSVESKNRENREVDKNLIQKEVTKELPIQFTNANLDLISVAGANIVGVNNSIDSNYIMSLHKSQDATVPHSNFNHKSTIAIILMVLASLLFLIVSIYLIRCIVKNTGYSPACSKYIEITKKNYNQSFH